MSGCDDRTAELNKQRAQAARNRALGEAEKRVGGRPRVYQVASKSPFRSHLRSIPKGKETDGKQANPATDIFY